MPKKNDSPKMLLPGTKLGFGKYIGCAVSEVARRDAGYLKWLEENTSYRMSSEVRKLIKNPDRKGGLRPYDKTTVIMPGTILGFGKYAGSSIDSLIYSAPDYVRWMYDVAKYKFSQTLLRIMKMEGLI